MTGNHTASSHHPQFLIYASLFTLHLHVYVYIDCRTFNAALDASGKFIPVRVNCIAML